MFKIGDRVEHYGGSSGTGGNHERYGCKGTVTSEYHGKVDRWSVIRVRMDYDPSHEGPWTILNLRLVNETTSYDPTQQGDKDDDI